MAKYRVWSGEEPNSDDGSGVLKSTSSISDAIKYIRKNSKLEEDNSGLQELISGSWDEWLDEDDQNIHEHLYMYGGASKLLKSSEDDEEEVDEDLDDDEDEVEEDLDDRLMNVIGGGRSKSQDPEDSEDDDDEEASDDDADEDDFDEEKEEA